SSTLMHLRSCRRQIEDEARPAASALRVGDGQRSIMRFGDGLGDRQTKAAVIAELVIRWAHRMEPAEDFLSLVYGDARPFVTHAGAHAIVLAPHCHGDRATGRREGDGV